MNSKVKTPWYSSYENVKTNISYPNCSLYEALYENSKEHLNSVSYNYFGTKRTYKEFIKQIDECARALKANNVKENDSVSICMPNTPEAIILFYAINKIGAIANMIHPLSSEDEIMHYVTLTNSKIILTIDISLKKVINVSKKTRIKKVIVATPDISMPPTLKVGYKLTQKKNNKIKYDGTVISWKTFIKTAKKYNKEIKYHFNGGKTAAILYSGGTTGFPKGIELSNNNFNSLAASGIEACQTFKKGDKVLAIMPIFHGFGLGICIHTVQYIGGTSILLPKFSAKDFDKLLLKYKPNVIAGVPTLFEALLKNKNLKGKDLSFIRLVISGGDSLSVNLKKKVDKFLEGHKINAQVREGYGLTECVTGTCLTPVHKYKEGSIGIPYPNTYYKIVNPETLEELPYGKEGEIVINSPMVMKGYFKEPEETKKIIKRHKDGLNWLHTGDVGYMDEEGYIYFRQRIKRIIISAGYNIYPQYIENIIDSNPNVLMSCVIAIKHPYKVHVPKALIVLKNGVKESDEILESIKKECEEKLAKYSWPYEYEFRKELKKTLVGKIAYKELEKEEELKCQKTN